MNTMPARYYRNVTIHLAANLRHRETNDEWNAVIVALNQNWMTGDGNSPHHINAERIILGPKDTIQNKQLRYDVANI